MMHFFLLLTYSIFLLFEMQNVDDERTMNAVCKFASQPSAVLNLVYYDVAFIHKTYRCKKELRSLHALYAFPGIIFNYINVYICCLKQCKLKHFTIATALKGMLRHFLNMVSIRCRLVGKAPVNMRAKYYSTAHSINVIECWKSLTLLSAHSVTDWPDYVIGGET